MGPGSVDEVFSWMLMECRMDLSGRETKRLGGAGGGRGGRRGGGGGTREGTANLSRHEPWDGGRPEVMDARRAGGEEE